MTGKPHPKSMALARLAGLVASMPSWVPLIIEKEELNLTPPPGQGQFQQPSVEKHKLVATHDKLVATSARIAVENERRLSVHHQLAAGRRGQVVT